MNCYYCDHIRAHDPAYVGSQAAYDLASAAPRCARHWRYVCASCGNPSHFMGTAWCAGTSRFFCHRCARERRETADAFWGWTYRFEYRSPWTGKWETSLDRLEHHGRHPFSGDISSEVGQAISRETHLVRYPGKEMTWRPAESFTDADVRANWNRNAEKWTAGYDDDGDDNRRYQSDEPMLELLGPVKGLSVLDIGSGNGYLSRKLARGGARVTGVELSDAFLAQAVAREEKERLDIRYVHGSATEMGFLDAGSFDRAVSNYVLMDIVDYEKALAEVARVLKPDGTFVVVISHPAFGAGLGWVNRVPDSPRKEERDGWRMDNYFRRGPYMGVWGGLQPVLSFHRPLRDYWVAFRKAGYAIEDFEEPSITERGRREMPPSELIHSLRIPYSCIFKLRRQAGR